MGLQCVIFGLALAVLAVIVGVLVWQQYKTSKLIPQQLETGTTSTVVHEHESGKSFYGIGDEITFTKKFSSVPRIIFSSAYHNDGFISAVAYELTATGFKPLVWATASGTEHELEWVAIEY